MEEVHSLSGLYIEKAKVDVKSDEFRYFAVVSGENGRKK
jgi:hypothetical protein